MVRAVGGLRVWRLAIWAVGVLGGWRFGRLAVWAVGGLRGWRFAWLAARSELIFLATKTEAFKLDARKRDFAAAARVLFVRSSYW